MDCISSEKARFSSPPFQRTSEASFRSMRISLQKGSSEYCGRSFFHSSKACFNTLSLFSPVDFIFLSIPSASSKSKGHNFNKIWFVARYLVLSPISTVVFKRTGIQFLSSSIYSATSPSHTLTLWVNIYCTNRSNIIFSFDFFCAIWLFRLEICSIFLLRFCKIPCRILPGNLLHICSSIKASSRYPCSLPAVCR